MRIQKVLSSHWKYDVFLNFRGEDTHYNFIDHLHDTLDRKGINVFRDDKELKKGKTISPQLLKAIEESRVSIVVLSRNYASSTWCLDELVKILQCMKEFEQMVFPVFYDVDPSIVRKQKGKFKEAFAKHEEAFKEDVEKVQTWKKALTEVANLSGWDVGGRPESKVIQEIVKHISPGLSASAYTKFEGLVGIDSRLEKLKKLMATEMCDEVQMIGIYGMAGIGKTTLARIIFELISSEYDGSSFLANVREISGKCDGLVSLQKELLCEILSEKEIKISNVYDGTYKISKILHNKKVLIVIDDVDHKDQLEKLVGKHNWFGLGSRIIITTRDEHLLRAHDVDEKYQAEELNRNEALQLLSLKAFKSHQPPKDYLKLSKSVVYYSDGLPLALEVLGSFLSARTIDEWEDTLKKLKRDSNKEILQRLEISFNGLEDMEKEIFLDIACFFKGCDRDYVTRILNACRHFNATIGINVLIEKSLITILKNNHLWMHNLLQEMGQQIIKRESPKEPGKRSRLWEETDIVHVLTKNTGTELVEGIKLEKKLDLNASATAFSKMINLRLLKLHNVQLPSGIEHLSDELRLLEWHGFPLKSLPSNLQLDKVVELDLSHSSIEQLWEGTRPLKELKSIKLRNCKYLTETPDFTEISNLEKLILEGCTKLRKIHPSLLVHKKINLLYVRNSIDLTAFPSTINMESLQTLYLSGCSKVESEEEESLEELDIRGTATRQSVSCISVMDYLKRYSQRYWRLSNRMLARNSISTAHRLPSLIGCRSLTKLILRECNIGEGAIPSEIGELNSLTWLYLCGNIFASLPASISRLSNLLRLSLEDCERLQFLPEMPIKTEFLNINGCVSLETSSDRLRLQDINATFSTIFGVNCSKLLGHNNTAFSLLRDQLMSVLRFYRTSYPPRQVKGFPKGVFQIAVPESQIPEWFHTKEGSSIRIKRHPHLYKNSKLIGYVACCVFVVHKHTPVVVMRPSDGTHRLAYRISSVDDGNIGNAAGLRLNERSGRAISEHVWLIFFPRAYPVSGKSQDMYDTINLSFEVQWGPGMEIKRCGARPIYEQDIDEQVGQSSSSTAWNLNKFPEDFGGSTMDDDSDYSLGFGFDEERKVAVINYLDAHQDRFRPWVNNIFRTITGVAVTIKQSLANNDEASEACPSDFHRSMEDIVSILVPDLEEFLGSTIDVKATKQSHPKNDEAETSTESGCCDPDEPQPRKTMAKVMLYFGSDELYFLKYFL